MSMVEIEIILLAIFFFGGIRKSVGSYPDASWPNIRGNNGGWACKISIFRSLFIYMKIQAKKESCMKGQAALYKHESVVDLNNSIIH